MIESAWTRYRNPIMFILGVLILTVIVSVVYAALITAANTNSNERTLNLMEDCVNPGGECYQRSQESTAVAVNILNEQNRIVSIAANHCADKPGWQTYEEIEVCVLQLLEEKSQFAGVE